MIWIEGRITADDGLAIDATDRTFEHGLGLFETLRTWGGRAPLLEAHTDRMLRSAEALEIEVNPASLPADWDVARLLEAEGHGEDRMLRITATGGTASSQSIVWMRSSPLPPPPRPGGAIVCVNSWTLPPAASPLPMGEGARWVAPDDFTARHKTLNYWFKRVAHEQARDRGYDETLIHLDPWGYTEASRSNLFAVIDDELVTTSTEAPIVPGIMRRLILDLASKSREVRSLPADLLSLASEIFLTNAVRGITPVARIDAPGGAIERPAPGPWTVRLQALLADRLERGESP